MLVKLVLQACECQGHRAADVSTASVVDVAVTASIFHVQGPALRWKNAGCQNMALIIVCPHGLPL